MFYQKIFYLSNITVSYTKQGSTFVMDKIHLQLKDSSVNRNAFEIMPHTSCSLM